MIRDLHFNITILSFDYNVNAVPKTQTCSWDSNETKVKKKINNILKNVDIQTFFN